MTEVSSSNVARRKMADYVQLAKPRITTLVLATTATGVALAPGTMSALRTAVLLIATSLVVASANALNCWLERESDGMMNRTKNRPLPAGRLTSGEALGFGILLALVSLPALALVVNSLTAILGVFALLAYVFIYTPLKKKSPIALVVGAIPGAIPPLMGWTGVTNRLDAGGLALFGVLFFWQIPHFLAIALYLKDDYARGGLRTLPIVRGDEVTKRHLLAWVIGLVPATLVLVPLGIAGPAYLATALVLGIVFLLFGFGGLNRAAGTAWARRTFLYSLVYLTILVAVLVADSVRAS